MEILTNKDLFTKLINAQLEPLSTTIPDRKFTKESLIADLHCIAESLTGNSSNLTDETFVNFNLHKFSQLISRYFSLRYGWKITIVFCKVNTETFPRHGGYFIAENHTNPKEIIEGQFNDF